MIVFERGQQLGKDDLNIFIHDDMGNYIDPYSITYSIWDKTGATPQLVGSQANLVPKRESVGYYYAHIRMDQEENLGEYEIKWVIKQTESAPPEVQKQRFSIIKKTNPFEALSNTAGVAYYPGQILGPDQLYINLLNERNNPFDPYSITYAVFDRTTGLEILVGSPMNTPVKVSTGKYYANFQIPNGAKVGDYVIRWTFYESASSAARSVAQEFAVIGHGTETNSIYAEPERNLIRRLRFLLRDNNPDRNYRFVPPDHQRVIQNFTETFGFMWTDEELYEYLILAVDALNMYPPIESYTLMNLPNYLQTIVVVKAGAFALDALAINWMHDEFDYSIAGVSLQIEKSSKYQGMSEKLSQEYQTALDRYKDFGVKYVKGIQQPKFGIGVSAALGPYSGQGVQARRNFVGSYRV